MPPRSLLLPSVSAGQSQISTDRSIPLLSPDIPCFMSQRCPSRLWVMSRFRAYPAARVVTASPPTLTGGALGGDATGEALGVARRLRRALTTRRTRPIQPSTNQTVAAMMMTFTGLPLVVPMVADGPVWSLVGSRPRCCLSRRGRDCSGLPWWGGCGRFPGSYRVVAGPAGGRPQGRP
jgi:hypothetical protein